MSSPYPSNYTITTHMQVVQKVGLGVCRSAHACPCTAVRMQERSRVPLYVWLCDHI